MLIKSFVALLQSSPRLLRASLVLALVAAYIRNRWRKQLQFAYHSIPLPALEDFTDKCKYHPFWRIAGAFALPPGEQLEIYERMGKPEYCKGRVFGFPLIITTNKADLNMASTKRKARLVDPYRPFIGATGIIFQEGDKARQERHMLNRGFNQHLYREMHSSLLHTAERMLTRMLAEGNSPKGYFDVEILISRGALESVAEAGFDIDIHQDKDLPKQRALKQMIIIPDNPLCMVPIGGKFVEWWNKGTIDLVYEMIDTAIEKRLQQYKLDGRVPGQFEQVRDLLDVVISSSIDPEDGQLDFTLMRDQTKLLFIAGSDTTSRTMHWTLVMLAAYPDVQSKVRDELAQVNADIPDKFDRLSKVPYMDAVFKEILRMYAPAQGIARRVDDGETEYRGYPIADPEFTIISYHSLMAQRRDDYYPQPNEFRPDRWLDGNADRGAFGAFSNGMRICLGRNFALTTMKTWLSVILENHRVELMSQSQVLPELGFVGQLAAPVGEYPLKLRRL